MKQTTAQGCSVHGQMESYVTMHAICFVGYKKRVRGILACLIDAVLCPLSFDLLRDPGVY